MMIHFRRQTRQNRRWMPAAGVVCHWEPAAGVVCHHPCRGVADRKGKPGVFPEWSDQAMEHRSSGMRQSPRSGTPDRSMGAQCRLPDTGKTHRSLPEVPLPRRIPGAGSSNRLPENPQSKNPHCESASSPAIRCNHRPFRGMRYEKSNCDRRAIANGCLPEWWCQVRSMRFPIPRAALRILAAQPLGQVAISFRWMP